MLSQELWGRWQSQVEGTRSREQCGFCMCARRQSLHDPLLVLNAESDAEGEVAKTVSAVNDFVRGCGEPVEVK